MAKQTSTSTKNIPPISPKANPVQKGGISGGSTARDNKGKPVPGLKPNLKDKSTPLNQGSSKQLPTSVPE